MSVKPNFIDYSIQDLERGGKFDPERPHYSGRALNAILRSVGVQQPREDGSKVVFDLVVAESKGIAFDVSQGIEAINFLLSTALFPERLRAFIDLLIGFAGSQPDPFELFEAAHIEVGIAGRFHTLPPLPPKPGKGGEASLEKRRQYQVKLKAWVEAYRTRGHSKRALQDWAAARCRELTAWQKATGFTFIEIEEGDYNLNTEQNDKTRYRVHLLKLAIETLQRARGSSKWESEPREAIREAAEVTLGDVPDAPPIKRRNSSREMDAKARLKKNRKTILTLLARCRDDLRELGMSEDQFLEELRADEETIFEEPELGSGDEGGGRKFTSPPTEAVESAKYVQNPVFSKHTRNFTEDEQAAPPEPLANSVLSQPGGTPAVSTAPPQYTPPDDFTVRDDLAWYEQGTPDQVELEELAATLEIQGGLPRDEADRLAFGMSAGTRGVG